MKTQIFWKGALVSAALLFALGCARDPAVGTGVTGGSAGLGEAASGGVSQASVEFDYSSVNPSSPYAVLDVTKTNTSYNEKFSVLGGFSGSGAETDLNFFWYINWVPSTDSADPVTSGTGLHTLSDLEVAHLACDNGAGEADFDLYVVVTSSDWSETDAKAWTSQSDFLFWDWTVAWDSGACADLPALPVEEDTVDTEAQPAEDEESDETEESAEEGGEASDEEGGEAGEEEGGEATEEEATDEG